MLEKRTKWFVLIFLLSVLCAVTFMNSGNARRDALELPSNLVKAPIRTVEITSIQINHEQLFEQFRGFASKHRFAIRISQTDPSGRDFLVEMWREDIEIVGSDNSDPGSFPQLFEMGFYNTYEERPVPLSVFDELIADLKRYIEEIPNITFTVGEVK